MLMLVYNMPVDRVQATRPRLKAANCLQNWCTAASICTECCIAVCAATAADFRFPKPNAPLRSASRERTKNPPWRGQGGFLVRSREALLRGALGLGKRKSAAVAAHTAMQHS